MIALSAGVIQLVMLGLEAGYSAVQLASAIKELSALPESELDMQLAAIETQRQVEKDRRAQHGKEATNG